MANKSSNPVTPVRWTELLDDIGASILKAKSALRALELPQYPAGGTVGCAAAGVITQHMVLADMELTGLRQQLREHEQRMASNKALSRASQDETKT